MTRFLLVLGLVSMVASIHVPIERHWKGGFKAEFCIPVTKELAVWRGHLTFDQHIDKLEVYKASLAKDLGTGKEFILIPDHGHFQQHTGDKICLSFIARVNGQDISPKAEFYIEGMDGHGITTSKPDPTGILWHKNTFNVNKPLDGFYALNTGHFDEGSLSVVTDPAGGHGHVMRVMIAKGHYVKIRGHRGTQFYTNFLTPRDSMTLSYDVYFQKGMDFVQGGKLPGLYGGGTNCTGARHSDACVTTRFMWRTNGDGEVYAYAPDESHQVTKFCHQSMVLCNPTYGMSLGRGSWRFQTGRWQTITQIIRLNTVGKKNGHVVAWLNGQKAYERNDVVFRTRNIKLRGLFFSVFFGGSTAAWAPTADSNIYFKNFIISSNEKNPPKLIG